MARYIFGVQETFDISRRRIRRVELREWRRDEKDVFQKIFFANLWVFNANGRIVFESLRKLEIQDFF